MTQTHSNHWKNLVKDYGKESLETRKNWYDSVADSYHRVRPRYATAMIERVIELSQLSPNDHILELGCGPGTATVSFAKLGFSLLSIEPCQASYLLAKQNCAQFPNVHLENLTFEEWQPTAQQKITSFDGILAATSWHWLTPETAYKKAHHLLKNNGSLILLWNTPPQPSYEIYQLLLAEVYQNLAPNIPIYARYNDFAVHQEQFKQLEQEILASSYFHQVTQEQVIQTVVYSISDYLELLSTLSPYIALSAKQRESLLTELGKVLKKYFGKSLNLCYCSAFHVAKKIN